MLQEGTAVLLLLEVNCWVLISGLPLLVDQGTGVGPQKAAEACGLHLLQLGWQHWWPHVSCSWTGLSLWRREESGDVTPCCGSRPCTWDLGKCGSRWGGRAQEPKSEETRASTIWRFKSPFSFLKRRVNKLGVIRPAWRERHQNLLKENWIMDLKMASAIVLSLYLFNLLYLKITAAVSIPCTTRIKGLGREQTARRWTWSGRCLDGKKVPNKR